MASNSWWQMTVEQVTESLQTSINNGLSSEESRQRLQNTSNVLDEGKKANPLVLLLNQFTDTMVLVLLGATVISGIVGAMADALTIMAIVVINAILGFIQEYKAERSLEEIKKLSSPYAMVIRDGQRCKIPAADLVPGDVILLEAGDRVPADIRLFKTSGLELDESALTGESLPVEKNAELVYPASTLPADQRNMAFMGTVVTRGRGQGIVAATGMQTIMGEIAGILKAADKSMTPLQIKLDQLGKILIIICLLVCSAVVLLGIIRGEDMLTMFMAGVSLAVAAIPEGLPAIVTVVLALGIQRMSRHHAIVRKLPAVETLGCTTVICSDKTGTLTRNQMTVKKMATIDSVFEIEGDGFEPVGRFLSGGSVVNPLQDQTGTILLETAMYCNTSSLEYNRGCYTIQGDPTEGALLVMAKKAGIKPNARILKEIPFDSRRKKMSVVIEKEGQYYLMMKGALEEIIKSCTRVSQNHVISSINSEKKKQILKRQELWAASALRVLGLAYKPLPGPDWHKISEKDLETDLILLGICGMIDPPRPDAIHAVRSCISAGITPVMITGDHPLTAQAIAQKMGISQKGQAVTGHEIDGLTDEQLYKMAVNIRVFARVSPQHKNRIVKVLKDRNQVVAMTGDGVNDAPAIKTADIGIAMGITGTQVSKEASAMVLADDNFATIVKAVYEGRAIYDNIRKFIRYLLGCNIGEVLLMFLASLISIPLPLLPIQILWVNLVTDGLPAMALGVEPPEPGIMNRKPRPKNEGIFARGLGWTVLARGSYIACISISAFLIGYLVSRANGVDGLPLARSMAFTTLVLAQLFYVFECRSEHYSPFELGFFTNKFLVGSVCCSVCMQLCAIYVPFMKNIFQTVSLDWWHWVIIIMLSGIKFMWRLVMYTWQKLFVPAAGYAKINS